MDNNRISKVLGFEIIHVLNNHEIDISPTVFDEIVEAIEETIKADKSSKNKLVKILACSTCMGQVVREVVEVVEEII